jgi:LPXTG-site transpeptidase (sortase) family protein
MKYVKFTLVIATLLIVVGSASLVFFRDRQSTVVTPPPKAIEITQAKAVAIARVAQQANTSDTQYVSGEPNQLSIPNLGIELAVTPGVYNPETREWTLTRDKAQYAVMTPEPNTVGGNTFIYGHYRKGVFSTLHRIKPGDRAIVTTSNGRNFTYVYTANKVVAPNDSSEVLNYQGGPMLTIQTCTGIFFENRQLFFFNLEGVS